MENIEHLLTEEYVAFSQKIASIVAQKKTAQEDFKKLYDAFKAEVATLDQAAQALVTEWEDWKAQKQKKD